MDQSTIFAPFFAMILLTLLVWTCMYVRRIPFIRRSNSSSGQLAPIELARISPPAMSNPSDHLKNSFEVPTLFHGSRCSSTSFMAIRGALRLLG